MARPIKDTPVLTGKDARMFEERTKANEKKTMTPSEFKRIMDDLSDFLAKNREKFKN